jgi:sporulation protein YlmC with PRC-barrel domain
MERKMPLDQVTLSSDETFSLIAASKVRGTKVYNTLGEKAGEVEDVMIDKVSGKVAYAVVVFGSRLGMGGQRRALPWTVLNYDTNQDGYVVNASDAVLQGTPPLGEYSDRDWGLKLHRHFNLAPFWR